MALILKGDCLELMKTLPDKSIDCFICDLPYGCLNVNDSTSIRPQSSWNPGTIKVSKGCPWDIKINLEEFWKQVKRLCRNENTPVLMFCNTKFGAELITSNPDWFRYDLVWSKSNAVGFLTANKMPMKSHEMIYVFSKKGAYYKRIDIEGDFPRSVGNNHRRSSNQNVYGNSYDNVSHDNTGRRCVKSVIEVSNKKTKGGHPTQKPAELYEWLLKRYCPEGGTMLDPTAGSFTSVFTARELGYKAIGIEKDNNFFWKAVSKI